MLKANLEEEQEAYEHVDEEGPHEGTVLLDQYQKKRQLLEPMTIAYFEEKQEIFDHEDEAEY